MMRNLVQKDSRMLKQQAHRTSSEKLANFRLIIKEIASKNNIPLLVVILDLPHICKTHVRLQNHRTHRMTKTR